MHSATGEIILIKQLDRERTSSIAFDVIAQDSGTPKLSDMSKVTFMISDENDNSPRIFPKTIELSIKEVHRFYSSLPNCVDP